MKRDEKVTEAIGRSAEHWADNIKAAYAEKHEDINTSADSCALCQMFSKEGCGDCPLSLCGQTCYRAGSLYGKVLTLTQASVEDWPAIREACENMYIKLISLKEAGKIIDEEAFRLRLISFISSYEAEQTIRQSKQNKQFVDMADYVKAGAKKI